MHDRSCHGLRALVEEGCNKIKKVFNRLEPTLGRQEAELPGLVLGRVNGQLR